MYICIGPYETSGKGETPQAAYEELSKKNKLLRRLNSITHPNIPTNRFKPHHTPLKINLKGIYT